MDPSGPGTRPGVRAAPSESDSIHARPTHGNDTRLTTRTQNGKPRVAPRRRRAVRRRKCRAFRRARDPGRAGPGLAMSSGSPLIAPSCNRGARSWNGERRDLHGDALARRAPPARVSRARVRRTSGHRGRRRRHHRSDGRLPAQAGWLHRGPDRAPALRQRPDVAQHGAPHGPARSIARGARRGVRDRGRAGGLECRVRGHRPDSRHRARRAHQLPIRVGAGVPARGGWSRSGHRATRDRPRGRCGTDARHRRHVPRRRAWHRAARSQVRRPGAAAPAPLPGSPARPDRG